MAKQNNKLTDTAIRKAEAGDKPSKLFDGGGLYLLVNPASKGGSKLWRMAYRFLGKPREASFGRYPEVSLAQARGERDKARSMLARGVDPVRAKHEAERLARTAAENSFESVARQWWEGWKEGSNPRYAASMLRRLEVDVFPAIGALPISEVMAPDIARLMEKTANRGAEEVARRMREAIGMVFRHAIVRGQAKRNPAADINPSDVLPKKQQQKHYSHVGEGELPALLRAIDLYKGKPTTRIAVKLHALTFIRPGELRAARWAEFDMGERRWTIPAERMKMRRPHIVPLSDQVVELLEDLRTITGGSELLFPGERDHGKPMSENTMGKALKTMGYEGRHTPHGWRHVASTALNERGFEHAHIELQMAHDKGNSVAAVYNHALYLPQRARLMQWYADFLDSKRKGTVEPARGVLALVQADAGVHGNEVKGVRAAA